MVARSRESGDTQEGLLDGGLPPLIAAAHELKSPLALIRQLSLSLAQGELSPGEQQQLLQQITLTSERGLRLTSNLTKSARLEDGLFELEPINPQELCRDIAFELGPLFAAHGRKIQSNAYRHPLLLVANRDLLRRIVYGFSENALHYTGSDSVVELQMRALRGGEVIRIGVRDYGPALSSDMWRSLKGKMAQAPQAIHARPESSGLGLYIAHKFAELMDGTIGVTRHRDGATFYVELNASRQLSLL